MQNQIMSSGRLEKVTQVMTAKPILKYVYLMFVLNLMFYLMFIVMLNFYCYINNSLCVEKNTVLLLELVVILTVVAVSGFYLLNTDCRKLNKI